MKKIIILLFSLIFLYSCAEDKKRDSPLDPLSIDSVGFKLNSDKEIIYEDWFLELQHFNYINPINMLVYSDNGDRLYAKNVALEDGLIDKGVRFYGTNNYCYFINRAALHDSMQYIGYTVSFWIKFFDVNRHQYIFVINSEYAMLSAAHGFAISITNRKIGISYMNFALPQYSNITVTEGQWYLITCLVNDIYRVLQLFINGEPDITVPIHCIDVDLFKHNPGGYFQETGFIQNIYLGQNQTFDTDKVLNGIIDEFIIIPNYYLPSIQIKQYYDFVKPG
ncbi:MAG: LamG domain-containing protein [Spirochaetes bacterium]|nr:LamG domain-containing protein [Spirochaetota bacterium]